ncbi:MAG: alanine--tRNA ligase, partial [Marinilabiliales bacterium]
KNLYEAVFNLTPFYAEGGGQVGDTGYIEQDGEKYTVLNTKKENNVVVHYLKELPKNLKSSFQAFVDSRNRKKTERNHTATHLLHEALRSILGNHVEQKGSLVNPDHLRFDFSHFHKLSDEEIENVENAVNDKIRANLNVEEYRNLPMSEAEKMGAMALFGEKYGDTVRVIQFGDSIELCGGTHTASTGEIGLFKIVSESAVAAGIRRIEAITGDTAKNYTDKKIMELEQIKVLLKNPKDAIKSVHQLMDENAKLQKKIEGFEKQNVKALKESLLLKIQKKDDLNIIAEVISIDSAAAFKDLAFQMKDKIENMILILGAVINEKPSLSIMFSDNLVKDRGFNAGNIIREAAKEIQGGGGGQPFYATAGGKKPDGIQKAVNKALELCS